MDEPDLRKAGQEFPLGGDLYDVSIPQLKQRLEILRAEMTRVEAEIAKKAEDLTTAERFFKKP